MKRESAGTVMFTAVIPAHNEERTIYEVAKAARQHVDEVIVVDDGSIDGTAQVAREAGAKIVTNGKRMGYLETIRFSPFPIENLF